MKKKSTFSSFKSRDCTPEHHPCCDITSDVMKICVYACHSLHKGWQKILACQYLEGNSSSCCGIKFLFGRQRDQRQRAIVCVFTRPTLYFHLCGFDHCQLVDLLHLWALLTSPSLWARSHSREGENEAVTQHTPGFTSSKVLTKSEYNNAIKSYLNSSLRRVKDRSTWWDQTNGQQRFLTDGAQSET